MEAIKCPNCGSEKVKELTEEKYVCLGCDNVFLIHNLSKEFRQTDAHIADVHKDLKQDIKKIMNMNTVDTDALIEKAEQNLKKEEWDTAYDFYEKAAEENPNKSRAWFGLYKALTGNFQGVGRYALFVCDGNYESEEDREEGRQAFFYGNGFIKRALECEDADESGIINDVTSFIEKCAEHGKKDIEDTIKELLAELESMSTESRIIRDNFNNEKKKDVLKAFVPLIIVLVLLAMCVLYFFAAGDWLGKLLGVVGVVLVLRYGFKSIIRSFSNAKTVSDEWNGVADEKLDSMAEDVVVKSEAVMQYCMDLDNYNRVLDSLKDKDKFIEQYVEGTLEGMHDYSELSDSPQDIRKFIHELYGGKIERYSYLLEGI